MSGSHGHAHGRGREGRAGAPRSPGELIARWRAADVVTRTVGTAVVVAALATLLGLALLWPGSDGPAQDPALLSDDPVAAKVVGITQGPCTGTIPGDGITCRFVRLHVDADPAAPAGRGGGAVVADEPVLEHAVGGAGRALQVGDAVYVTRLELPDGSVAYSFYDYQRATPMWILAGVFVVAVLALGRWRGLGALAGLGASLLVLVVFMLPSLLDGNSPVLVAVVAASAIAFVALYLAHGVSVFTSVALIGTFLGLVLTALLSWMFIELAKLTGYVDDSAFFLAALGGEIDLRGILLAGFVIGALGVLDDVTVTQVSAVAELRSAHPGGTDAHIFRAGLNIGRDHVSSTVNTLFLAYAGAALPLLLLFTKAHQPVSAIAGREIVATEIVRSLVGSIGLVAAVPITTWLAVKALPHAHGGSGAPASAPPA